MAEYQRYRRGQTKRLTPEETASRSRLFARFVLRKEPAAHAALIGDERLEISEEVFRRRTFDTLLKQVRTIHRLSAQEPAGARLGAFTHLLTLEGSAFEKAVHKVLNGKLESPQAEKNITDEPRAGEGKKSGGMRASFDSLPKEVFEAGIAKLMNGFGLRKGFVRRNGKNRAA